MFIKYFTNPMFNNKEFADMLNRKMGVAACEVEDGVILDRDAFLAYKPGFMPHWAYLNLRFIKSEFHTREATAEEAAMARGEA